MQESNRIEHKQTLTEGLEKEVVAFLNSSQGGIIYIGINKLGEAVGVENADDLQLKIYYQEKGLTLNEQFATNLELLTEDGDYNYVAYLLADNNGASIKVAK